MNEQEFIDKFGMTPGEYGQRYGTLQDPNQGKGATLREKTVDATANFLQGLGSDQYTAYKRARDLFGNPNADLSESIGVMDFTPLQLPFAIQEGKRALQRGDTAEGLFDLGFAGVEMFPAAKLATTPIKGFAKSLASKLSKSTDNLGALPTDPSRREFIASAVATPVVAGVLGDLPVSKMIDDVAPVVKKIPLPENFNPISDLSSVKETIDDIIRLDIEDDIDEFDDIDDIIEQTGLGTRTEIAQEESIAGIPEQAIAQMREDYGSSDEEIIEILEKFFGLDPEDAKNLVGDVVDDAPVSEIIKNIDVDRSDPVKSFRLYKLKNPDVSLSLDDFLEGIGEKSLRDFNLGIGQRVFLPDGKEVYVSGINKGKIEVRPFADHRVTEVDPKDITKAE